MANTLKFIDMVAREALAIAHEKCAFIGTVDRQYDDQYAKSGAKIGSVLRVRNPNKYTRRSGSRVMNVQDVAESTQTITLATQDGVDMQLNSAEMTMDTDSKDDVAAFSKRYIQPAMSVLMSNIESDFLAFATKATYQSAGTAGTALTDLVVPGAARAKLNRALAPKDNRFIQMDSVTMGSLVNGSAAYFAPSSDISEQYREGFIARRAMADFYENERTWTMTNSSDVTIDTDNPSLVTDGGTTLDMHTLSAVAPAVGSVFTVAGVYDCHPETKAPYPNLKQFTIVTGYASGTATANQISPPTYLTGPNKNVCSSTGADLAITDFAAKTCVFVGLASTSYAQSLMYNKEAFQFVTADLPLMGDSISCARRTQDGLSIRVWQASDIINDRMLMRLDILYGMAALRPEWSCRMLGSASA